MSFEKKEWKYRDTITADELNRMEEGISSAQGGGDCGYSCSEGWVTLIEESVTTAVNEGDSYATGEFTYSELITADSINVTFNGTEYNDVPVVMEKTPFGTIYRYGAQYSDELANFDFSTYPFAFSLATDPSNVAHNVLVTETASTYQVKIETLEETVETSECFKKAVQSVVGGSSSGGGGTLVVKYDHLGGSSSNAYEVYDKTWNEVNSALESNMRVVVQPPFPPGITPAFPVIQTMLYEGAYSIAFLKRTSETSVGVIVLYACSADGYLQSKRCDSEGGGDPIT